MRDYIIRRLLLIIPTVFLVTLVVFFTVRSIPGTVIDLMVAEHASESNVNVDALKAKLGLDVPLHVQYARWIGNVIIHGDLGRSIWKGYSVSEEVLHRFPVSFELGILAIAVGLVIAVPIGLWSAVRQDTWGDYLGRSFAIACIALPSFWLGTMVVVFPSVWWHWSPPVRYIPFFQNPVENLKMMAIPVFILGMVMSGTTMRMTRTMMLEVLRQDYIRTAWSKGLKERVVVTRHALRNALIPVVTIVGLQLPILIGGSIVLEQIFVLPGVGLLIIEALNRRDYTVVSGVNLFMAAFVLLINLLVDLTYGFLDPRVKYK
jgi:peptide/nickel transport system permease protein